MERVHASFILGTPLQQNVTSICNALPRIICEGAQIVCIFILCNMPEAQIVCIFAQYNMPGEGPTPLSISVLMRLIWGWSRDCPDTAKRKAQQKQSLDWRSKTTYGWVITHNHLKLLFLIRGLQITHNHLTINCILKRVRDWKWNTSSIAIAKLVRGSANLIKYM